MPIVDFHIHPARYETYQPWAKKYLEEVIDEDVEAFAERMKSPEAVLEMLSQSGVDYAVVLAEYSPITTGIISNQAVAEFCRASKRLIPFASVNPHLVADPAQELRHLVNDLGFRGLKLYPTYHYFYPNEALLYPVYAVAQELGLPVMFHTGTSVFHGSRLKYGDPLYLDDVAVDFPDLNIVQVHGGRGFWYDRAFTLAWLHPNVLLEISGLPPQRLLEYFPKLEKIREKVVFASDWPAVKSIASNIEAIRGLPLGEEAKSQILGGNALRLLRL